MPDESDCSVCGDPIPEEYGKHDPKAPVYDDDAGEVYHLGCESEVFEEVYCEL